MRTPSWDRALHDVRSLCAAVRRSQCRAYQFWDGFDHYNSSTELWDSVTGSVSYSSALARYTAPAGLLGQGMKCNGIAYKFKNLLSNESSLYFGFSFLAPQFGTGGRMVGFNQGGSFQSGVNITSAGGLAMMGGGFGTVLLAQSAPSVISTGVWHWLDLLVTFSPSSGSIAAYLDAPVGGSPFFTATSLNTANTGNAWIDQFYVGDVGNQFNGLQLDDFHCHDTTGSAPNSVLGSSRIYTKKPNGAGYSTLWTPNGASANWQCVDDSPPDGDTTYNSSATAGQIDGYDAPSAGLSSTPNGLVRRSYIRTDGGAHTFQNGIRSGSSNGLGTAVSVPSSYGWTDCATCYVDDPATSAPFTAAAADAVELVIDETS